MSSHGKVWHYHTEYICGVKEGREKTEEKNSGENNKKARLHQYHLFSLVRKQSVATPARKQKTTWNIKKNKADKYQEHLQDKQAGTFYH